MAGSQQSAIFRMIESVGSGFRDFLLSMERHQPLLMLI
jgi:hypothetical protein